MPLTERLLHVVLMARWAGLLCVTCGVVFGIFSADDEAISSFGVEFAGC